MTLGETQQENKQGSLLDQPIMAGVEVKISREGGLYECMVPIGLIDHTDVPVDHGKLVALEADFRHISERHGGTGQKTPTRIGYVEGESRFRIIDGFHRYTTIRHMDIDTIYTTVEMLTLDELLDERIRNANMHENVRFARIAEWMGESWDLNLLSERVPITSTFTIAHFDNLTGAKFQLTPEELDECAAWATTKADAWGTTVSSLYTTLKIAASVAPELIHNTRPAKAARAPSEMQITPSTVSILSSKLGGKFEHQRLVTRTAARNTLSGSEVSQVAVDIAEMTVKEARAYISGIDWDARRVVPAKVYKYDEDSIFRPGLIRGSSAVEPLAEITKVTEDALSNADLSEMPVARLEKVRKDLGDVADRVAGMIAIIGVHTGESGQDMVEGSTIREAISHSSVEGFVVALGIALEEGEFPAIENDEQFEAAQSLIEDDDIIATLTPQSLKRFKRHLQSYVDRRA